ncbi:hypothetical protein B0H10DRAFT_2225668 [Mycena sp. CBHHK59/15]|nr:hypothetical protein B0H10DRAFT_2235841 [Mycena sp. CBHHK59/15]KAJ6609759.1 hypothetical protein B0H10DRAFT_2225668 [Mycena sp. CBHHK59/15]
MPAVRKAALEPWHRQRPVLHNRHSLTDPALFIASGYSDQNHYIIIIIIITINNWNTEALSRPEPRSASMSDANRKWCSGCKTTKSPSEFGTSRSGIPLRTCLVCVRRTREKKREKSGGDKENAATQADDDEEDLGAGLGLLTLEDFLDALAQEDDILKLQARVDITSFTGSRREEYIPNPTPRHGVSNVRKSDTSKNPHT